MQAIPNDVLCVAALLINAGSVCWPACLLSKVGAIKIIAYQQKGGRWGKLYGVAWLSI